MVEISYGCFKDFMGSGGRFEQAKEAIRCAPLGLIQVDHSRGEASGFQRDGYGSHRESPNSKTNPNHGSGAEMRRTSE